MKRPAESNKNVSRRSLVQWLLGVSAVSTVGALLSAAGTVQPPQRKSKSEEPVAAGDRLVMALGTNKGQVIKRDSILIHEAVYAFPEGKDGNHDNLIFLCRLDPKTLQAAILEWTAEGYVAYSALCTHLGCTVNFSHEAMEGVPYPHLHCPCHGGIFDPHRGAMVVAGPPPRPLPQLPIKINEQGELIAAGWFKEPPGPVPESELQQWRQKNKK